MARRVFFSAHYKRDVRRIVQVRNSWVVRSKGEAQPFYDAADFEEVKRKAGGVEKWIEEQLKGTSVSVILFGAETFDRPWVQHEIKRSHELGKGLLAIDIHSIKDPQLGTDVQGKNPLDYWQVDQGGRNDRRAQRGGAAGADEVAPAARRARGQLRHPVGDRARAVLGAGRGTARRVGGVAYAGDGVSRRARWRGCTSRPAPDHGRARSAGRCRAARIGTLAVRS
jgi:hypothetical protein